MSAPWIGVDLDGTLALHPPRGTFDPLVIGDPVPDMVARVAGWHAAGWEVRVFTARVCSLVPVAERLKVHDAIRAWTLRHVGVELEATAEKDFAMIQLWDDRAIGVFVDTGRPNVLEIPIVLRRRGERT